MNVAAGARRESHQPVAVREVMSRALNHLAGQRRQATPVDYVTWKTIIGAQAARGSQPTSWRQGRLAVRVTNPALLYELSLRTPSLVAALRHAAPDRELNNVSFAIGTVQW